MSDEDTSPNSSTHNYSTAASPTDTRTQPRRFEPITHDQGDDDGDEESTRIPSTIRRNRPPAISTGRSDIHSMSPFHTRDMLLIVSKAPRILTTPPKKPLPKVKKLLYRMRAAKIYKALHRRLASKCFLPNHYHQRASRRWPDEHLRNTMLPIKVKGSQ